MKRIILTVSNTSLTAVLRAVLPSALSIDVQDVTEPSTAAETEKLAAPKAKRKTKTTKAKAKTRKVATATKDWMVNGNPPTARQIVLGQFLPALNDEIDLATVREHMIAQGHNRNAASAAFFALLKTGDVKRIQPGQYRRIARA